jgi:hypothetical protein
VVRFPAGTRDFSPSIPLALLLGFTQPIRGIPGALSQDVKRPRHTVTTTILINHENKVVMKAGVSVTIYTGYTH